MIIDFELISGTQGQFIYMYNNGRLYNPETDAQKFLVLQTAVATVLDW